MFCIQFHVLFSVLYFWYVSMRRVIIMLLWKQPDYIPSQKPYGCSWGGLCWLRDNWFWPLFDTTFSGTDPFITWLGTSSTKHLPPIVFIWFHSKFSILLEHSLGGFSSDSCFLDEVLFRGKGGVRERRGTTKSSLGSRRRQRGRGPGGGVRTLPR